MSILRVIPNRSMWQRCGEILLLAAAYVFIGRMALLLAIPPGYAMAVYPPAGIALGFVLVRGYALAPGVAIGSFVLNLWIGWEAQGVVTVASSMVPAAVCVGAALQAIAGAWLVRRFVGYPTALDKEWDILLFLVLGGPVGSLVNASVGVGALYLAGIVSPASLLSNWATWWIGDTLGVLVLTPLLMIAFGEPRSIWWSRRFNVGVPLLVSMAIVVAAFVSVRDLEQKRQHKEFREEAGRMAQILQTRLGFHSEMVKILERLFASSDNVTREDFHIFVSSVLARFPTLQALEWAPRVAREDRAHFEAEARRQTNGAFTIIERATGKSVVRAADRDEYFPVFYVEPMAGNEPVFGFDVGSTTDRRRALEAARDTGLTVASEPIALLQARNGAKQLGGLLFTAVYARGAPVASIEQRRRAFRGVVLSVVRIDNLIQRIFSDDQRNQIRFQVFDASAPSERAMLYDTLLPGSRGVSWSTSLNFGERQYAFVAQPSGAYWERHRSWAAWWMLVGGLLFTSLLGTYLLITSAQAYRVETLVQLRTRELSDSKDRLKENATQLEATTSLQRAILNSANFSIISTDVEGIIQVFNVGAEKMLGYSSDEMVGMRTPLILHDREEVAERAALLSQEIGRTIAPGYEVFVTRARYGVPDEREWTYIRKDGSRFPVMLSVTALWNENRELTGFLGVAYDLTERKKIENMKNEFISTVSHELRTPLTSIHGALDLLLAGTVGHIEPEIRNLVAIANDDCNRLVRLVNDILDIEKIESGNMRFDLTVQPLLPLIDQAITITQSFAAQYDVFFVLQAEAADARAAVDADRIIQVLINLLSNAAKYSKPHSTVQVRVTSQAGRVRVAVIDRGTGIAAEFHDRIFQKFAQADSSDSRQKDGTGLGLSICKAIVERHHGHIDFHSTPGEGSEFYFELALANVPAQAVA